MGDFWRLYVFFCTGGVAPSLLSPQKGGLIISENTENTEHPENTENAENFENPGIGVPERSMKLAIRSDLALRMPPTILFRKS